MLKVTQAVFAVFHHFELAHQLRRRGHLQKIYSTWPWARLKREGLPKEFVARFPLLQTSATLLGRSPAMSATLLAQLNRWNALAFDNYTYRRIERCDAFISIAGAGLRTGKKVQAWGGKHICDRGSTHQRFQEQVMFEEYRRWNVDLPTDPPHIALREEKIYEQADGITVPSSVAARSFVAMGVPAEKMHVIPYGVRLDRFTRTAEPVAGEFNALFAGQVSLRKGIPYLLQAFARVKHPRKTLTIVGAMQEDIRRVIASMPQENVQFLGTLAQPELAKRMSQSHLLVLPSVEEGLALVQGQAMACGCPVLATVATGAEDLFRDGVEGFIVPDRDVEAFTSRMQQVADDPALQQRLSEASLLRVKHLGGWEQYGNAWDELLHSLTGIARDADELRQYS